MGPHPSAAVGLQVGRVELPLRLLLLGEDAQQHPGERNEEDARLLRVHQDSGEVLVTGATGGVGSVAVAILGKLGFNVVAATGKTSEHDFLRDLGVKTIISREEANDTSGRPLQKPRWAGVVDTVGGNILATALKATKYAGLVAACGNAMSPDLNVNVFPFILRGVSLLGVDSVEIPMRARQMAWQKLAGEWSVDLSKIITEVSLEELNPKIDAILKGAMRGRVLVDLSK